MVEEAIAKVLSVRLRKQVVISKTLPHQRIEKINLLAIGHGGAS
jgi:hypothetical protein